MIICSKCGETLPDDLKFCPSCGTGTATAAKVVEAAATAAPEPAPVAQPESVAQPEPVIQAPAVTGTETNYQNRNTYTGADQGQDNEAHMNFGIAIKNFVTKIVDFTGRAGKKEYWFGALFFLIIMVVGVAADYIPFVKYGAFLVKAAACLAFVSATVRRIRDVGMPWTRIFFYLIPVYGQIRYFVELTK